MTKDMTHIGDILGLTLKKFRPSGDIGMIRIWDLWDQTVGDVVAKNAKPGAFKDGILIIHVGSSVWMHHLTFLKQKMLMDINQALSQDMGLDTGLDMVRELKFKIAAIHP